LFLQTWKIGVGGKEIPAQKHGHYLASKFVWIGLYKLILMVSFVTFCFVEQTRFVHLSNDLILAPRETTCSALPRWIW
jgi:hypothetical protein